MTMETVVRHRNRKLLLRLRRNKILSGVLDVVLAALAVVIAVVLWFFVDGFAWVSAIAALTAAFLAYSGVRILRRTVPQPELSSDMPDGVAWVLRPDGVEVVRPSSAVVVPWERVVIAPARKGFHRAVRIGDDEVATTHQVRFLSHTLDEIIAEAARYTELEAAD